MAGPFKGAIFIVSLKQEYLQTLRDLLERELSGAITKDAWYCETLAMQDRLNAHPAVMEIWDEEVQHYLSDFDIRQKSPEYAKVQIDYLKKYLQRNQ